VSDLLVFGRRAAAAATEHAGRRAGRVELSDDVLADAARAALAPFEREGGENPYAVQHDLQQTMHDLVGIIRTAPEMQQALDRIAALKERVANLSVEGHRQYNPGWHLALDLPHMLTVSECIARAALERQESRGGHTRDDFPTAEAEWGMTNVICSRTPDGAVTLTRQPLPQMPPELAEIFEEAPA
jgi:succinate dehydrogenase / fumarate reductase flavoprotein subunit